MRHTDTFVAKVSRFVIGAGIAGALSLGATSSWAGVVGGVGDGSGATPTAPGAHVAAPGLADFDNVAAPCLFVDTAPLVGFQQGVFFAGGGAILDECSNFGLNAFSAPNFLAFNNAATYTDGTIADLPEILLFLPETATLRMQMSEGTTANPPGGLVLLLGLGTGGLQLQFVTLNAGWQAVGVNGPMLYLLILGNPNLLVVDNVQTF